MNKTELTKALADKHKFEAKEGATNTELELFLEAFDSRAKITKLENELAAQREVGAQVTGLISERDTLKEVVDDLKADLEKQAVQLEAAAQEVEAAAPQPIITHKNKKYVLNHPLFRLPGDRNEYSAASLKESSELVERVLNIKGQNILKAQ